jgi:hypothetical protein
MAGFSVYAFRNWRHTWAGRQWPVLAWPAGLDWAAVRRASAEGRVDPSGWWAKFEKGIGKWFIKFWTAEI